jgi:imidazolonepropionase-like amidohydrolase
MRLTRFLPSAALLALIVLGGTLQPAAAQLAVRADTVYTMAGPPIVEGVVLVQDGQIEQVGAANEVTVPDGYQTLTATVVTPGLIDAHSVVGLAGLYNIDADQDQLDTSDPIQPALRAIDAYNAREELVAWVRDLGVTTLHTGHGPGAPVSGQTMVVKTHGTTVNEALVDSVSMVAMTLGPSVEQRFESPGTRAKTVAMLREHFVQAQAYREKRASENPPTRDLGMDVMVQVLNGELPALITAHRHTEILSALRLAEEFDIELVLDGAAEAYMVLDEIQAAGVPVIVHPPMIRPGGEAANAAFTTAARLRETGIPFAFQSGYEGYVPKTRVVLFEAAIAAAHGLDRGAALQALTIDAARILGLDDRIGSLEPGKDADLVLYEGDPFEYTTRVCHVIINGTIASDTCR